MKGISKLYKKSWPREGLCFGGWGWGLITGIFFSRQIKKNGREGAEQGGMVQFNCSKGVSTEQDRLC